MLKRHVSAKHALTLWRSYGGVPGSAVSRVSRRHDSMTPTVLSASPENKREVRGRIKYRNPHTRAARFVFTRSPHRSGTLNVMKRFFALRRPLGAAAPVAVPVRCPMNRSRVLRMLTALGMGALAAPGLAPLAGSAAEGGMGGMMGGNGAAAAPGDMNTVMTLFRMHRSVRRTVVESPNGISATTESDDPQVAALIHAHVASMYARVDQNRPFTRMSRTLPALFRTAKRYERQLTMTAKGVAVIERSSDPQIAAVIRAHGREVSGFVHDGMDAMMNDMMQGGMMDGGTMRP